MLNSEVFLPIVGQGLVEGTVLSGGDVLGIPRPDGLGFIEFLVFNGNFLDLLCLLRLVFLIDLLNLDLPFIILFGPFIVFDLLIKWLGDQRRILHIFSPSRLPS